MTACWKSVSCNIASHDDRKTTFFDQTRIPEGWLADETRVLSCVGGWKAGRRHDMNDQRTDAHRLPCMYRPVAASSVQIEFQIMLQWKWASVRPSVGVINIPVSIRRCRAQDSWRLCRTMWLCGSPLCVSYFLSHFYSHLSVSLTHRLHSASSGCRRVIGRIISKWVCIIGRSAYLCPSWRMPDETRWQNVADQSYFDRPLMPICRHQRWTRSHCWPILSTSSCFLYVG